MLTHIYHRYKIMGRQRRVRAAAAAAAVQVHQAFYYANAMMISCR
jgi:hypothetical protein